MSRDRKKNGKPAGAGGTPTGNSGATPGPASKPPTPPVSKAPADAALNGWKLWRFRLLAVFLVPLVLLALAELGLRVAGFGIPTHFLLPYSQNGRDLYVQNTLFGWRFFGPAMSRQPDPLAIPKVKPPHTIRIFVFGESAAYGDPQPAFGLPRMLQAMLELRHPGVKFEVINAAMTGINSNVILPIAEDCAGADGDIWVVYMGNNEVIGPFGAGTIFGPQVPPVSLIRASLALKATRLGQLIDAARRWWRPPPSSKSEWGGMQMFLDQQIRADDPRMAGVYANFQRNLADIIRTGRRHGAAVVVSTVPVNVRDCAPFASAHRPGLSAADLDQWNQYYRAGTNAARLRAWQDAGELFRAAAAIDDTFAELRYRQAICAGALTNATNAQTQLIAARDLDTLRFRCDSRLNDLIRQAVPAGGDPGVALADADRVFEEESPEGVPGDDLFYEHVHLTFLGNYLLTEVIVPQVEKLLPPTVVPPLPADTPAPTGEACGRRLAWNNLAIRDAVTTILERLREAPFTAQLTHDSEVAHWEAVYKRAAASTLINGTTDAIASCEKAIAANPDDARLYQQLASVEQTAGEYTNAIAPARKVVELLPASSGDWFQLGLALGQCNQFDAAADAFRHACNLDPEDVWSRYNLAQAYEHMNRREDAIREYRRDVAIKPRFGPAWLALGQVLAAAGNKTEAENCYHLAITNRIHQPDELAKLAKFCQERGWNTEAVEMYDEAHQLSPGSVTFPYEAGLLLLDMATNVAAAGHLEQAAGLRSIAAHHFGAALYINTNFMQAHYQLAMVAADPKESAREFAEVVRLAPKEAQPQAHLNYGLALERSGDITQAIAQFQEVLKLDPGNARALQRLQILTQNNNQTPQ